jgi:hypothetical protein
MKKRPLNNKLKAEHKSDEAVLMGTQEAGTIKEESKNEWIKTQFAKDAFIYERIKCPIAAMGFCLMHRV